MRTLKFAPRPFGFTLIEVMVALVIVALSLSAILAAVSQQLRAAGAIKERTYANWIAHNRIVELRLASEVPEVDESDDEVRFADQIWAVRTTVSETGVENLYRIDVAVGFAGDESFIRTVTGFVGEPGIPGQSNLAWTRSSQATGEDT